MLDILEGLLFLSGDEGLSQEELMQTLKCDEGTFLVAMQELIDTYEADNHGIRIIDYGGKYKFVSKDVVQPYAQQLFTMSKQATLSNAALETLAIIAYKQPITRSEIEEIRGVNCDTMVRKLLARDLIQECGRSDVPGKPYLYSVTDAFLDAFQLKDLHELPQLRKIEQESLQDLFNQE